MIRTRHQMFSIQVIK